MSKTRDNGRPAPRRRPASFGSRFMGWVNRVTPWFAVAVLVLAAAWMAFAIYDTLSTYRTSSGWGYAAIWAASLVGTICMGLACVRVAWPSKGWPSDGAVRTLTSLGLVFAGFAAPMVVLRSQYGLGGVIVALTPLLIFYVRIRRPLVDILPAWCGGTWKPDKSKRRPRRGEDIIKHPPRSWDETSGPRPADDVSGGRRRRQSKKKRKSGR